MGIWQHERPLMLSLNRVDASSRYLIRGVCRMVLGPLVIAGVAGVEFAGRGTGVAVLAGYMSFVAAQFAVRFWGRWQLRRARARLAVARARSGQLARRR